MSIKEDNLVLETADVKPCPHGFVFISQCKMCGLWISVKDRLPENTNNILVYFKCLYPEYKVAFFHNKNFYPSLLTDEEITKWVTHWMLLPEPPK